MSTCQKKTGSVVSLESMGSTSAMSQIMTCQELKYNGKPIYFIKSSVLIFSSPNISLAVGKEKATIETASLFTETTPKHKIAFSMLKFTVFFFGISWKGFEKAGKALKTAPFMSFRAKPWFRINGRDTIWAEKSALSSNDFLLCCFRRSCHQNEGVKSGADAVFKARPQNEVLQRYQGLILRPW